MNCLMEHAQEELITLYTASAYGRPPTSPAQLALATIIQAYTGVSDDEVIEATLMDRRWQLVLDCLDAEEPPFEPRNIGGVSQTADRSADGSAAH